MNRLRHYLLCSFVGCMLAIKDEIPAGWYFVLSGALPGDPGGALQVVVGQKTTDGFRMARYCKP